LLWAREKYRPICCGYLNEDGDLLTLSLHPCYATGDDELERISKLPEIRELGLGAELVTDEGLAHLESMPNLKSIHFHEAEKISDAAWARLRQRRPDLKITID
jgi:hypothetical protein